LLTPYQVSAIHAAGLLATSRATNSDAAVRNLNPNGRAITLASDVMRASGIRNSPKSYLTNVEQIAVRPALIRRACYKARASMISRVASTRRACSR
jgi:hypothetical protein